MHKFEKDRIFCSYTSDEIMKKFTDHTGYQVSENQEIELRNFLYDWSLKCIDEVINA